MKSQDPTSPSDSEVGTPEPESSDDGRVGRVPFAVSEGDFSTPTQRKRTITRPRGLRALEATPSAVEEAGQATDPASSVAASPPSPDTTVEATAEDVPSAQELSPVDEFLASPPTPVPRLSTTPPAYPASRTADPTPWPEAPLTPPPTTSVSLSGSYEVKGAEARATGFSSSGSTTATTTEAGLSAIEGASVQIDFLTPPPGAATPPPQPGGAAPPPLEGWQGAAESDSTRRASSVGGETIQGPETELRDAGVTRTGFAIVAPASEGEIASAIDGSSAFGGVVQIALEGEATPPAPALHASIPTPAHGKAASPPPLPKLPSHPGPSGSFGLGDGSGVDSAEAAGSLPIIENAAAGVEMRLSALAGPSHGAAVQSEQLARDEAMVDELLRRATEQMTASPVPEPTDRLRDAPVVAAASSAPRKTEIPPLPPSPDVTRTEEPHVEPERLVGDALLGPDAALIPEVTLSPLAQTLANMAESFHAEPVLDPSFEIDIIDAPLVPPTRPRSHSPSAVPPPLPSDSLGVSVAADPGVPEALADRPRRPRRSKPWYEEVFDENYLRTLPFMTPEQTLREVDFIETSLAAPKGSSILDVGCGYGRHAIELVQRGLSVTGLDLSLPLLLRAADESQKRALSVNFVHSDMRGMAFDQEFDGAYCMLSSFGYFDEESNVKVAEGIARALKPGARLLLDVVNRDYVVGDLPARIWWEGDGCVVLEEVEFNFNTSRILTHRSVVFEDGRQLDQEISVRAYSLHELGKLLRQTGLRVIEVSGSIYTPGRFFGAASRNLIVLAERRRD